MLIHSDDWNGPYVQLDGTAEVIDQPDAVEPLVDYFRSISGEHPDWDEYRQAMRDQGKSLIRVTIESWGPIATGGFPPEHRGLTRGRQQRPVVLLATCSALPDGEEWTGTTHLTDAFAERGIDARWVVWDDPDVDWSEGLVAVRSTWDYETRREEFLGLGALGAVDAQLRRGLRLEHRQGLPARAGGDRCPGGADGGRRGRGGAAGSDRRGLDAARAARWSSRAWAPAAAGSWSSTAPTAARPTSTSPTSGPAPGWCSRWSSRCAPRARPRCSCSTAQVVSQAQKVPAAGEIRVHEQYGGTTVAVPLSEESADLARRTVEAAGAILGGPLDYARVDQMRLADGTLAVSELEVTEPGLYLDVLPGNAAAFADLVAARLTVAEPGPVGTAGSAGRNRGPDVCTRLGRVLKMQLALSR